MGTKLEQELEGNKWRRKLRLLAFISMRGRLDRDSLLATVRSAYGLLAFDQAGLRLGLGGGGAVRGISN